MSVKLQEIQKQSWDFKSVDTKIYTHCYHNYPAMMIPQIAERLINLYGKNAKILFDPYCGTGTSLVEASIKNINAIGTDLNPLARLIAEVKTSKINLSKLDFYLIEFNNFIFEEDFNLNKSNIVFPNFKNIDFWFKKDVKEKLAIIKMFIKNIEEKNIQKFFLVAFSETVRESSLTRNSEFKLYRMSEKIREKFNPNVFEMMNLKLERNRKGLEKYLDITKNTTSTTKVYDFNTSETVKKIKENSIDIIVTSPPYGDSKTTVAYGQFSRLANQWLDVENASNVDNSLMGGKKQKIEKFGISILDNVINKISQQDIKRAEEVFSFYKDYYNSIKNVSSILKSGGYACYVVGNRRVKNTILPTDEITRKFFEINNFSHQKTFTRNIPNKRMPSKNSPTNEVGITATTMNNEYIVIMKKII